VQSPFYFGFEGLFSDGTAGEARQTLTTLDEKLIARGIRRRALGGFAQGQSVVIHSPPHTHLAIVRAAHELHARTGILKSEHEDI
jgi:hypothetical protein